MSIHAPDPETADAGRKGQIYALTSARTSPIALPRTHRRRVAISRRGMSPTVRVVLAVCVHVIAASALYAYLVRALYVALADTPRLVVLERGLVRILAASIFLPPVAPTLLLLAAAVWVGRERREPAVGRLLSAGALALAADSACRLLGVLLAAPASSVGELIDMPARFSPGPRMLASAVGHEVSGHALVYWSVVCSFAAIAVVVLTARAVVESERARLDPVERRRRAVRGDTIAYAQALVVTAIAFASIAFAGEIALPPVTQLFLRLFG